jgi:hypothetical protein
MPGIEKRTIISSSTIKRKSALPLLVPGFRANHAHRAFAADDLTIAAQFFYRCSDFHYFYSM